MELFLVLIAVVLIAFWCSKFVQLMSLGDNLFPGKYDKLLWFSLFILIPPIAPFAFGFWRLEALVRKAPK